MHILMIAPQPFFQYRGTPFSVRERLKSFSDLGHSIDLITYHIGDDVDIPGVRIRRCPGIPFIRTIPIGPSWVKFPLDFALMLWIMVLLPFLKRPDFIHSHEEGAVFGILCSKFMRRPHVYDMHSSLPQQLINYDFTHSSFILHLVKRLERWIIRSSSHVIVVCPWLEDLVKNLDPDKTVYLIENPPVCESADENTERRAFELRHTYELQEEQLVVYTGTLEINQGMDILLSAIPTVVKQIPRIRFVLVGGEPHQVETLRSQAKVLGIEQWILLTGQRPTNEMPAFMYMADILISPRKFGQNTPLKIYSYLQSGKPIVATDLETHTQVLDTSIACLVNPDPEDFARGLLRVLRDPEYAHQLGQAAKERLESKYSWTQYMDNMRTFCDHVTMHIQRKS